MDKNLIKTTYKPYNADNFIGRESEIALLKKLPNQERAGILVVYGRRRVGKTTLLQKVYADRQLLKFEGLEKQGSQIQRNNFLEQLSRYVGDIDIAKLNLKSWREVFILLAGYVAKGKWTIYLEELQWLANYREDLISDLKFVWDNYFSRNPELLLILCGSSPAFLIDKVMHSRALYNRSQTELPVGELSLQEAAQLFKKGRSAEDILDAYLTVGGIPQYLRYLAEETSAYMGICNNSFKPGAFFLDEANRVFVSNLDRNPLYQGIIKILAEQGPQTGGELRIKLKMGSGGSRSQLFQDLLVSGLIASYAPGEIAKQSREAKYYLADPYLNFYFKFVKPIAHKVQSKVFVKQPTAALSDQAYRQFLGYSFERFCWKNYHWIAERLGFGAIAYEAGPFYQRGQDIGAQIDLLYCRKDRVLTVCEIKYQRIPPGKELIIDFEKKLATLKKYGNYSIHKVLISPNGANETIRASGYFDRILKLEDFIE